MYLLDTNVLSEIRKAQRAHPKVQAWSQRVVPGDLYLTATTVMEIEIGTHRLMRRDIAQGTRLRIWIDQIVLPTFAGRILSFDAAVAQRCAPFHVPNPCSDRDTIIAATALVHGMAVVTRNIADFAITGVPLINPFE
jgi:toxin FitB